jgi:serine-type D-Ala-D-Ala carboxypeptidase/endopeptidase (penicillin-binding protein 4)
VAPKSIRWVAQHQSFPLADLLKKMNRFSNNAMAEIIASSIGGAKVVQQKTIAATGVPANEIQLVNGSGLAVENRMSPRAVCALFLAIDRLLKPQGMGVADIFTVVGTDESVLDQRSLPQQSVLKSGTLDTVSALAGTLTTQKLGTVWFAVLDNDGKVETFRNLQEELLETLQQSLGSVTVASAVKLPAQTTALTYAQLWKRL